MNKMGWSYPHETHNPPEVGNGDGQPTRHHTGDASCEGEVEGLREGIHSCDQRHLLRSRGYIGSWYEGEGKKKGNKRSHPGHCSPGPI